MAEITLDRRAAQQGELPAVCVYSGLPATSQRRMRFLGPTPFTFFVGSGCGSAKLPLRPGSRPRTGWWLLLSGGLLLAALASFVWVAWLGLLLMTLALMVRSVSFYRDVHCIELTWDTLTLRNVSPEFVQAYYQLSNEEEVTGWPGKPL